MTIQTHRMRALFDVSLDDSSIKARQLLGRSRLLVALGSSVHPPVILSNTLVSLQSLHLINYELSVE